MLEGYLFRPLNWPERLILLPAALGLLHPALWTSLAGVAIFAALALWQWVGLRRRQVAQDTASPAGTTVANPPSRSEEHTSELQSLMRISYAVFCLKKKKK